MSGLKDFAKKGWHPKGEKGIRSTIRSGIGRGGDDEKRDYSSHSAAPLSTLKDPASFGPPPRHVAIHGSEAGPGGSAASPTVPARSTASPSIPARPAAASPPPRAPARQDSASSAAPAPSLPPRLPPRQNSHPDLHSPAPPPTYDQAVEDAPDGYINTQAADRLGRAGVSVPGLNIGAPAKPQPPPSRQAAAPAHAGQMNELQARFARMGGADTKAEPGAQHTPGAQGIQTGTAAMASASAAAAAKKPKPPPPRKKPELAGSSGADEGLPGAPPPIPLSSKPRQ